VKPIQLVIFVAVIVLFCFVFVFLLQTVFFFLR